MRVWRGRGGDHEEGLSSLLDSSLVKNKDTHWGLEVT